MTFCHNKDDWRRPALWSGLANASPGYRVGLVGGV